MLSQCHAPLGATQYSVACQTHRQAGREAGKERGRMEDGREGEQWEGGGGSEQGDEAMV